MPSTGHPPTVPPRRADTVIVSRGLLVTIVGGLVVAIVAIAFLLGRESARSTEAPSASVALPEEATSSESVAGAPSRSSLPPPLALTPGTAAPSGTAGPAPAERRARARVSSPPPNASPEPAVDTRTRDSIASYFDTVDALGDGGVGMGDPNDFAMMILGESASGNFSTFDQMLSDQRDSLRQLRGMNPPGELRTHHRQTIELTQRGIRLLEQVKGGLESGDMTGLMTLSVTAQDMQSDAEAAERLATDIKRKYGLAP